MFSMFRKMICLVSFVLVLGLILTRAADAADPGLVGCWKFDEGSGTIAYDSSGNGNDGTLVLAGSAISSAWVSGKYRSALSFDGVDDYVNLTNQPPITNGFTFSAWVKRNGDSPSCQIIFNNHQFFLRTMPENENSNNPFEAFVNLSDGSVEPRAQSNVASTIGQWFFVTVTWDKTTLKIYVNGELNGSSTRSGELTSTTVEARIGRGEQTNVNANPFNGLIDEVALFDVALEAKDIEAIMNNGLAGIVPDQPFAIHPSPGNEATDVPRDVVLSWEPGTFAAQTNGHKVYLGESFDDVNNATGGIAQDANSYAPPQRLNLSTTYYWRVDEVNAPPTSHIEFKGRVWSFTVEPVAYSLAGEYITAIASSSNSEDEGPENTINGSGLNSDDLHSTENTDMWLSNALNPNAVWIEYEFDEVYKLYQMRVWNHNTAVESLIGFGLKDVTIEYSVNSTDYTTLGNTHEFARASGAADYAHNTTVYFSDVPAKYVRITANSNWGGILDQYGLSEVRFFYIPVRAREPNPDSGATDVELEPTLGFRAGREVAMHDVYFSTDEQAVIDGNTPVTTVTDTSYGPLSLDLGKTYYWRVDEVNEAETPTTWQGDIWDFTTQEYFVVDDFESYNDLDPADPESNRIFNVWLDGYDDPTNGSLVGYENPPFAEQTIVHGGSQSMPVFYDNSVGYSEATLTLTYPRDWTEKGVTTLTIWFRGDSDNAAETLYVALNGSAVVNHDNPDAAQIDTWTEWNINLQAFADQGVNLANVNTIALGLGNKKNPQAGGSGTMYFDDIRLYPPPPTE